MAITDRRRGTQLYGGTIAEQEKNRLLAQQYRAEQDYFRERANRYGPSVPAPTINAPAQDNKLNVFKDIWEGIKGLGDGQWAHDWIGWEDKKDDPVYQSGGGSGSIQYPSVGKMASPAAPTYTIAERGDTLESIGQSFDFDPTTLAQMNPDVTTPSAGTAINIPSPEPGLWAMKPEQIELGEKTVEWWKGLQGVQTPEMYPQQWSPATPQPGPFRPELATPYGGPTYQPQPRSRYSRLTGGENLARAYGFTDDPRNERYASLGEREPTPYVDPRGQRGGLREAYSVETEKELRKLPLPEDPSMFEAINWMTGKGLTGTAMHMAGRQLRLDRPEYWDATGARLDILSGTKEFLLEEFVLPDGTIDWDSAIAQDPYIIDTIDKLGYLDEFFGEGEMPTSGITSGGSSGGYSYPIGYGYGGSSGRKPSYGTKDTYLGLTSWSI